MSKYFAIICTLFFLFSLNAQNCNDFIHAGEATFYGGVAGSSAGNCSIPVAADDFMHGALNNTDYDNSNACGSCIEINGEKGTTIVKVVDRCPECKLGDVDLTKQAFEKVANPTEGRVPITWKFVPCPISTKTIKVNFKSGSSVFWTAIQFRDLKYAIATMEYRKNGNWINVNRVLYNFFIETNGIESPMKLRITSVMGEQIVLDEIDINTNVDFDTKKQFSTPKNCEQEEVNPDPIEDSKAFKTHTFPGRIEAEDFDNGGQGVAYNDTDTTNNDNTYRNEFVGIESTGDRDGQFNINNTQNGEWLQYTINNPESGNYIFSLRTASIKSDAMIRLSIDGNFISKPILVTHTGSNQSYSNLTIPSVYIPQGKHAIRIHFIVGGVNLNYFTASLCTTKLNATNFKIQGYPNPTKGIFYLSRPTNWKLFDLSGKLLRRGKGTNVDLTNFLIGTYFLVAETEILRILKY